MTISDAPTQAEVQAINDGLVAAVTLLKELRAAAVEKGIIKGPRSTHLRCSWNIALPSL